MSSTQPLSMEGLSLSLIAIPALPLVAAAVAYFLGRWFKYAVAWLAIAALAASGALTLHLAPALQEGAPLSVQWAWLSVNDPLWQVGLTLDGLSWVLCTVVTVVGTLVQLYSLGYMRGDARFAQYFAKVSLFCAAMLGLVLADHFLLLFICWELVGLCSYLLIGFWFERPAAAASARKAFLTTRIGDVGLLLALFLLFWHAGSLAFRDLEAIRAGLLDVGAPGVLTVISALIFLGAVGKSAQVPLHVWLPDAMEGPTAVSALIHAATMVAAGVYLVARTFVLFTPQTLQGVFAVGLITHLLAGTVALTQTDIKRVLAYSTISQLGLMVLALGLGAVSAALFHLYTHAFFKALLFLAAGSVIHAVGVQDLGQLGGLRRRLPFTAGCFGIAALSMSGLPGLSGFWSKDAILVAARSADPALFWLLCAGAVMTTAYITRLYLRCFHGAERLPAGAHPHEASLAMGLPMAVLAVGAVAAGWVGMPLLNEVFYHGLGEAHAQGEAPRELFILSAGMVLLGSVLAWWVGFKGRALLPTRLRPLAQGWYRVAAARYYADEVYARVVIGPVQALARWGALLDQRLVDGAVNTVGRVFAMLGRFKGWVDRAWIDGAVNGIAGLACGLGELGRGLQSGVIHHYLIAVALAALAVGFWYAV